MRLHARSVLRVFIAGFSLLSVLVWTGQARAIPVCEDKNGAVCREDLEARVNAARQALQNGLINPDTARNAINELSGALESFAAARAGLDTTASLQDRCSDASSDDERALKRAARAVRDSFGIAANRYKDAASFNAARAALTALTSSMIDAVDNNLDELESLIGPNDDIDVARQRLQKAESSLGAGKVVDAADKAQSAYDIASDFGNDNGGCLNFQF